MSPIRLISFRRCRQVVWLGVLGLWLALPANGESSWFVRPWLTDDGLPDNDVTGVAQNSQGYLWVATQGGLALFDGAQFREVELATPSQRSRPLIRCMLAENAGPLWLALEGGTVVCLAAGHTNVFGLADGLSNYRPTSLAQGRDGSIWLGFVDGSADHITGGKVTRFTAKNGLAGTGPCVLAADSLGQVWFAKGGQLSAFRENDFARVAELPPGNVRMAAARDGGLWICAGLQLLKLRNNSSIDSVLTLDSPAAGVSPSVIYEDHSGAVWLGTLAGGLFHISGTNVMAVATSYPDVLSISEDRENNLWIGTGGGGLNRLRARVLELQNTDNGLPFSSVRSVCEDAAGNLWAAAQNGELARCENGEWRNLSGEQTWAGGHVTCVADDGRGGVWVGTSHEGLRHWFNGQATVLNPDSGLGGESIRALQTDRAGDLWISTESPSTVQRLHAGKFQTYSRPVPSRPVRSIAQDRAGTVWLGTMDGLLLRVDGDRLADVTAMTLKRTKPIRCLYATPDGDLWIGYAGAGLGRIHNGIFSSLSTERGLHDAYICSLALDDGGGFWFSSDHGIFQVRQQELEDAFAGNIPAVRSVLYGREESLPSLQGNFGYGPGFTQSRSGKIWFPTRSGLVAINPKQTAPNHLLPPVVIEQMLVDGVAVPPVRDDVGSGISPRHRKIEIQYTALSFVAPENVMFRYKLDNWDDGWINAPRGQRSVSYSRLPAGSYAFHVIACNNAGIWNETGATLPFEVEPFVWQTWWFRLSTLSALVLAVALAVRYQSHRKYRRRLIRLEEEAMLQKERARIARDIHDELGANLTQISLLGKFTLNDLADPQKAEPHVAKMAAIARQGVRSVDEIVWAVNPRNDTLAQLLDYAGQYAVDFLFAAGIRCRIDLPEKIPAQELAADVRHGLFMVVKEALNNAVKHSGASEIIFRVELPANRLILNITDNGRGFAPAGDHALADGLRNMTQRAADLGGSCEIASQPGNGTKVRVELRLP